MTTHSIRFSTMLVAALSLVACSNSGTPDEGYDDVAVREGRVAAASVAMLSCLSDDGYLRAQTYFRSSAGGFFYPASTRDCVANATRGCDSVRACFGLIPKHLDDVCDTCDGNYAIVCNEGLEYRRACNVWGDGTCVDGECVPSDALACDPSSRASCDAGGHPTQCDDFLQIGPACPSFGLSCEVAESSFSSACVGNGAACTSAETQFPLDYYHGSACAGSRLTTCLSDRTSEFDCSLISPGMTCQHSGSAFFCGYANECDPSQAATCEGNSVQFCNAGKLQRVDCAYFGFTACSSVGEYARCT